jgi:hypothetical protein
LGARETLAGRNITFLDGVIHHRTEDGHFKADGGITDKRNRSFTEGLTSIGLKILMPKDF